MLDVDTRTAVLQLKEQGHSIRSIARSLRISRNAVRRILSSGRADVPLPERRSAASAHHDRIEELHLKCKGNLVRVQEMLAEEGVEIRYSTLTAYCRRHGIGGRIKVAAGSYHFGPGEEMQHDTSPHDVTVGGKRRRLQCASVVLCYSRMMYVQLYPTFNRFYCKVFLAEAIDYFGGAAGRCMVDNTSVIIAHGTGAAAVPAPEMKGFADHYGFVFQAHEKGDANRSARVERPFHFIEINFYPGREFRNLEHLNQQARQWCDKVKNRVIRTIRAVPAQLHQQELPKLKPLPLHVPEVCAIHHRSVDLQGFINLHGNRYSAPAALIGRMVEVKESINRVRIFDGHRVVAEHKRIAENEHKYSVLPEHKNRGLWRHRGRGHLPESPEEKVLRNAGEELKELVDKLLEKHGAQSQRRLRKLYRMYLDYPTDLLLKTVSTALKYGMLDLRRIERMLLRNVAGDFFRLPINPEIDHEL